MSGRAPKIGGCATKKVPISAVQCSAGFVLCMLEVRPEKNMIYTVAVKKTSSGQYIAYCTSVKSIFGTGASAVEALMHAQMRFNCFVHDKNAVLDVVFLETSPDAQVSTTTRGI